MGRRRETPVGIWVAVEFVGIDEGLREDVTQLVSGIQREQKKKSLT